MVVVVVEVVDGERGFTDELMSSDEILHRPLLVSAVEQRPSALCAAISIKKANSSVNRFQIP